MVLIDKMCTFHNMKKKNGTEQMNQDQNVLNTEKYVKYS